MGQRVGSSRGIRRRAPPRAAAVRAVSPMESLTFCSSLSSDRSAGSSWGFASSWRVNSGFDPRSHTLVSGARSDTLRGSRRWARASRDPSRPAAWPGSTLDSGEITIRVPVTTPISPLTSVAMVPWPTTRDRATPRAGRAAPPDPAHPLSRSARTSGVEATTPSASAAIWSRGQPSCWRAARSTPSRFAMPTASSCVSWATRSGLAANWREQRGQHRGRIGSGVRQLRGPNDLGGRGLSSAPLGAHDGAGGRGLVRADLDVLDRRGVRRGHAHAGRHGGHHEHGDDAQMTTVHDAPCRGPCPARSVVPGTPDRPRGSTVRRQGRSGKGGWGRRCSRPRPDERPEAASVRARGAGRPGALPVAQRVDLDEPRVDLARERRTASSGRWRSTASATTGRTPAGPARR